MRVPRCRRYECQNCGAVLVVEPRGVVARRHYSSLALGFALALFGEGVTAAAVRRQVSPFSFDGAASGWRSLRRWIDAARRGVLFALMPALTGTAREIAAAAGRFVMAHAPPTLREAPARVQVLAGALAMS
jgi:hypothetical protein